MYDTVAISADIYRPPDTDLLIRNGCKPFFSRYTGEPYKLVLNAKEGAKEPRLTISKNPLVERKPSAPSWILKTEVSIGAWLFGSNIYLPSEKDISVFFSDLSDFVYFKTNIPFNPHSLRMTRLDVTSDYDIGANKVLETIKMLSNVRLEKYNRRPFNETGIAFENKGKVKNKSIEIYSKYHDLLDKGASDEELELAKGVLRFEIQHKDNRAVSNLAKSLKLPNHTTGTLLTRETHEKVIAKGMKMIGLDTLLETSENKLQILGEKFPSSMPLTLAGHLVYKSIYGSDYGKLPFINLAPKTLREYDRKCAKAGILSLE